MPKTDGGRVARRRAATRARILEVAARRFATAGLDGVRLDEIADEADVARGTLYSHFPTKQALVSAILEPVLRIARRKVTGLASVPPRRAVDRLLRIYLDLWRDHPDALRVAYRAQGLPLGSFGRLHESFLAGIRRVLARAEAAGALRHHDAVLAGKVLARVAVPLLELYSTRPDTEVLFVEGLRGLLLVD